MAASDGRDGTRAVNETRLAGGRVIAIGTTVVRVLESAAKIALGYKPGDEVPPDSVCGWQTVVAFSGETDLYHSPRLSVPGGRRDDHQFPPAPFHAAHAGERVCGERA